MRLMGVLCLVAVTLARGQSAFEGQIDLSNALYTGHLSAHLKGPWPSRSDLRADVGPTGAFQFSAPKAGTYTLQVVDESGREILSQTVEVNSWGGSVSLSMPDQHREVAAAGKVTIASLLHKPKPAAYKSCLRAQKYVAAHDFQSAASELEKAVAADPLYAMAHGNLGAEYARLSQFDDAAFELRRAIELDPATGVYYSNLAWVLAQQSRITEATTLAQRGVQLDPANPESQFILGWLLSKRQETWESAIPHLVFAAREIPAAHRVLADVYHLTGRELLAHEEMRRYVAAFRGSAVTVASN